MTATEPTTAPVTCRMCGQTSEIPHDEIREASEADRPPPCPVCEGQPKAPKAVQYPKRRLPPPVVVPFACTAAEAVLLAAAELHSLRLIHGDPTEFSEWDLSVAAWQRDPKRFGLRGYADRHPDHKRVSMEIMGQKTSSPVVQGFMVKVRPNYYRLTAAGVARAEVIRKSARKGRGK